jgi:hypothetical protein
MQVAHYQVLKQLHEKLDHMEFSDDGGRGAQFWLVDREMKRFGERFGEYGL